MSTNKKYKLLKDLPTCSAGTIFEFIGDGNYGSEQMSGRVTTIWQSRIIESKGDWFELVDDKPKINCSKCGKNIGDNWEENMCNGQIKADISSQATTTLWGENDERVIGFNHPALISEGYQDIEIVWGKKKDYKLCWHCHRKLLHHIGNWLKEDKGVTGTVTTATGFSTEMKKGDRVYTLEDMEQCFSLSHAYGNFKSYKLNVLDKQK